MNTVIKDVILVNEGEQRECDVRIKSERIDLIAPTIEARPGDKIVSGNGRYLLPGMIDDQVHFREPGLVHKGCIYTESRAAVAGGITSYMEMPNVKPSTTNAAALDYKHGIAAQDSIANYSFYLGATEDNIEDIKQVDPKRVCGVKVFMGASTGDLLVENPKALDRIFRDSPVLIATHCEHGAVMERNQREYESRGQVPKIQDHPVIRDVEACYASSSYAVNLARQHGTQLHVLHITTAKELALFDAGPIAGKSVTAEACVHHLWFSQEDYDRLGHLIKCNPAIKAASDRDAVLHALHTGQIDIIATDHAPHTRDEKAQAYSSAPAGMPLVQHALLSLMDHVKAGRLTLEHVVLKAAHNPAIRFAIEERGFVREGYYADLVLVDPEAETAASDETCLYRCGWTPFHGHEFSARIASTWVNGKCVFDGARLIDDVIVSSRLTFDR
jgi:dihydroorotase